MNGETAEALEKAQDDGQDATQALDNIPDVESTFATSSGWDLMQRQCKALAASSLVPKEYRGDVANCLIALEMAHRTGASPLMVMQNLYVVHGRPSWSAQFMIATWNKSGSFAPIRYHFEGDQGDDSWGCRATSAELSTGEEIVGPLITIALAKAEGWFGRSGSKWQTMPEQMLRYRAAAWLVRTHAPEISMGLYTADEAADFGQPVEGSYSVDEPKKSIEERLVEKQAEQEAPEDGEDDTSEPEPASPDQPDEEDELSQLRNEGIGLLAWHHENGLITKTIHDNGVKFFEDEKSTHTNVWEKVQKYRVEKDKATTE